MGCQPGAGCVTQSFKITTLLNRHERDRPRPRRTQLKSDIPSGGSRANCRTPCLDSAMRGEVMMHVSAVQPELDDQLWRLRTFTTIAGTCMGGLLGLSLALVLGVPGAQGILPSMLGMTMAVVGWLAAREVNQIRALLDELTQGNAASEVQIPFDICLHCGSPLRQGLVFCTNCGQRLEGSGHG